MTEVSVSEELEALRSIYCKPQEFQEQETSEGHHMIMLQFDATSSSFHGGPQKYGMSFVLPPNYPLSQPNDVAVFCDHMSPQELLSLQQEVQQKIYMLKGDSMLLKLCLFVHDRFKEYVEQLSDNNERACISSNESSAVACCRVSEIPDYDGEIKDIGCERVNDKVQEIKQTDLSHKSDNRTTNNETLCMSLSSDIVTSVLQLDHMRSRTNYVKYIKKWTAELNLKGKLIFCKKYIFIVLQGRNIDIKEYVIKNKTVNVDVDSKGKSCKERLLKFLCEVIATDHIRFTDFAVINDIPSIEDLSSLFESFFMKDMYMEYILPCLSVHSKKSSKK